MLSANIWRILSFSTRTVAGRSGCNKTRKMKKKEQTKKIPNNHKPNTHTRVVFSHYKLFWQFECFKYICLNSHSLRHTGILRKVLVMNTCPCLKKVYFSIHYSKGNKGNSSNDYYLFISSWVGSILRILQSDWFREWAVLFYLLTMVMVTNYANHSVKLRIERATFQNMTNTKTKTKQKLDKNKRQKHDFSSFS